MSDQPPDPGFTPISPNPFIVGNPVRGRAMFFGRETEFELVRKRFEHSEHGGLLVFCGERRSGKTSILFQILDRRLGPAFIPVLIDMQSMAVGSEIEFLTRISEAVLEAVGRDAKGLTLPQFTKDSNHATTFQKFIREVLQAYPGKKLVLLFDEYELFENKIDAGQLAQDVLHILASLMENQPVFLIFTGSQHLEQRRKDYWKILGKSLYKMISFLERDDALNLIRKPVEGRVRYSDETVEAIYRLTAGQAFYTQAICQSLVDQMNDRRTNLATPEILTDVVDGLINNPLPQMIFLWDALERDEKLVLSLVAESLADARADAGVADVTRLLRARRYPLTMDEAQIAITLEKLFKSEMLSRNDRASLPEYAYRMDLWRLWIRRQHSVWQVMRELGIEIRTGSRPRAVRWAIAGGTVVALAIVGGIAGRAGCGGGRSSPPVTLASVPSAPFSLEVQPADAMIELDGRRMGIGPFRDAIAADQDHSFLLSAPGYADSTIPVRIAAGDSGSRRVSLRTLLGELRIETQPPGASVTVDGRPAGVSPVTVPGVAAVRRHRVEATLGGRQAAQQDVAVEPNRTGHVTLILAAATAGFTLTSDPSPSEIRIDGHGSHTSPAPLSGIAAGPHVFTVSHAGFVTVETTIVVTPETRQVHVALAPEPPGTLVVQGDRPAGEIWIDGAFVIGGVQNSGAKPMPGGTHLVHVVLRSGEIVDTTLALRSRERVVFDYSRRTVTRMEGNP